MQDFLKSQYDYVCFFYGLAFFILAIICFSLGKDRFRNIPWVILGSFGLVHGLYEWVDMAAVFGADIQHFSGIQLAMLVVSYMLLFEFARSTLFGRKWRWQVIIIYAFIVAVVFLKLIHDPAGLNAATRYLLGFPAGLLASVAVVFASRLETKGRGPLLFLGATMVLYAIVSGLVVPKTDIWLASRLNTESFYRHIGFPVQFIRGLLVLCSAMAVWFYSQALPSRESPHMEYHFHFKPSKWTIAITMIVLILLGWVFTNYFEYYASNQIVKSSKADMNSPLNRLNRELTKLEWGAISMSVSARLIYVLTLPEPRFTNRARRLLEDYRKSYSAQDCFITDAEGVILASASGKPTEAAPGGTCAGTPYFKEAIAGNIGHDFVRGSTNDERIYYVSAPVKKSKDVVVGVVVIKKNIAIKPILQYRIVGIVITLFMCALAIFFFVILKRRERLIAFAEEANRQLHTIDTMKNDFISIVSHELRTPLTSIKNAVSLLSKGWPDKKPVDNKEKELLDIISNNTTRQIRMITDLLDISKIENGVMSVRPENIDMIGISTEVINSFKPEANDKQITLEMAFDKKPLAVYADPEHARRVLSNLVHNAIKFTQNGGKIMVMLDILQDEVMVTVSDTGAGIPPDNIDKLFNKFYRQPSASNYKEGSGLGLAISKGLVEAQGGRIWVESDMGKGSSFRFTLPLKKTGGILTAI
ncbi:MAG: ATP-binding protein [Candidatus Omnitrophota bacterium]|jgi:signal transduction histidine kinase